MADTTADLLHLLGELATGLDTARRSIEFLADRVARLEVQHGAELRGRRVIRADDDAPCPHAGTILDRAGILGDEFAWVLWDSDRPDFAPAREALDELTPAP